MSLIILNSSDGLTTLDLTDRVPMKTYQVNTEELTEEWTDSNYTKRYRLLASKVKGSFNLKFRTITEYTNFVSFVTSNTSTSTGLISVTAYSMNKHASSTVDVRLLFTPVNDLPMIAQGKADGFTVSIEES